MTDKELLHYLEDCAFELDREEDEEFYTRYFVLDNVLFTFDCGYCGTWTNLAYRETYK